MLARIGPGRGWQQRSEALVLCYAGLLVGLGQEKKRGGLMKRENEAGRLGRGEKGESEKKLGKVIVPDKWKEGASNTNESGGRKINENKLLSKKNRWTPYGNTKCIICKQQVHQDAKYCHTCAYSKGVCAMCGKQVLDTKLYKQSNV
ncbi:unnamed protein product [Miscanthus lutarioriparius]|uniref:Cysteine-rich PDZ-binding protein n=1 Tax=Miscanthus lutarioriparius TaxID=422564 RepID=A0A811PMI0_9POAL|nr:unnamed protein product [Miscanthus lutarioriparius]